MGRIQRAYSNRFEALIGRLKARRIRQGVQWFSERTQSLVAHGPRTELESMNFLCDRVRLAVKRFETRRTGNSPSFGRVASEEPIRFLCDVGLGGLARWLRAAGYEALWFPGINDD